MGLSENRLNPYTQSGFADHDPVFKWLSLGIYPIFRHTHILNDSRGDFAYPWIFSGVKASPIWFPVFFLVKGKLSH